MIHRDIEIGVKTTLADGRVEQTIDGLTKRIVDIAAQHQEVAVRAALVQLGWIPPEQAEEWRRDAERLTALEALLDEQPDGMLLLHHGNGAGRGIAGIGLRNTNRSLRQAMDTLKYAIDAARKEGV